VSESAASGTGVGAGPTVAGAAQQPAQQGPDHRSGNHPTGGAANLAETIAAERLTMRLSRCLAVDLEVAKNTGKIHAFAGIRPDTGESVVYPDADVTLDTALAGLDDLAAGAEFLIGHNLIEFDSRHLSAANPNLRLHRLPMIDTLWLNPLAFPRHPYHRLVKHYKDAQLQSGRRNDPAQDAQLALKVFSDQQKQLLKAPSELLVAWHHLTGGPDNQGFELFFEHLRREPRPSGEDAHAAIRARLDGAACRMQVRRTPEIASTQGWPLAYALAWLHVAGGNSVMPPWVRHHFPEAGALVRRLRDLACDDAECGWCRERHDASRELKRFFGFDGFRPEPADSEGRPLQQSIVEAAMGGRHVLGILPTGTGKSVCYQIPALSRYEKTGAVTVVISPLVALMADQVAGLEAHGIVSCVTVNGTLSMPERSDALQKLRLGDAAILLISPEQLRSVSIRRALEQREIGAWVLDEAHCLSKWGHDFRPDYRYVGRFIRERAEGGAIPPVLCLTATAKPEVKEEIVDHFWRELGIEMRVFDGGSRRTNLNFVVVETNSPSKLHDIQTLLEHHLPPETEGGAIVYCATRRMTADVAGFLQEQGIAADRFHAGLPPEEKKDIQQSFIAGELRAIAATNAFGMGIDKPDVRLVIHADIPSSLENYLQEAGRAGRDRDTAHCVLLYTKEDVERQFSMSARSRLTRREIHGVLRALRRLGRRNRSDIVIASTGEILDEDEDKDFRRDSFTDDTRARTALAWLEESQLLTREENRVQIFPSCLRVSSVDEARRKLDRRPSASPRREPLLAIVEALIDADPDEGISTDLLMSACGLSSEQVRNALHDLVRAGIASNDTALTAFVHAGVRNPSRQRLAQAAAVEERLLDLMQEMAPDLGVDDTAPLNLRIAAQRLKDSGHDHARPEHVARTLRGIAADGRDEGTTGGSLTVRKYDAESALVTLKREWPKILDIAARRRAGAVLLLEHLVQRLPRGLRGNDLLAETTLGELVAAVEADAALMARVRDSRRLVDRSLMWLHEQEVIRLNKGLTVFRPAMTIHLAGERRGFAQSDFKTLQLHYDGTVRQIHIMAEFAQQGLESMADAVRLSLDYFVLGETEFLRRWLPDRARELSRQTTPESWRDIVESLRNPAQRRLVADDRDNTNVLVLAGPGSGKTRVLVHRIAYLIRSRREDPRGILALAYNRHAAVEIRRRLAELIDDDSRGVIVLTCHALAMRLVGTSFSERADRPESEHFQDVLKEATALLRGEGLEPEEAEETRSRLLAGFRWILVDEYQDVGAEEYALISALAGRTLSETDAKLTLFAVGDDDQNIYSFKGSSVRFIRDFEQDYSAKPSFLTDNYRSTGHIIEASNAVIGRAVDRMKAGNEIRIDRARAGEPAGGSWGGLDPVAGGRVQVLAAGQDRMSQAQAAIVELQRLSGLAPDWDWSRVAVMAKEWSYLEPVRSLCELEGIPVQMANEELPSIWHLRETQALLGHVRNGGSRLVESSEIRSWLDAQSGSPWNELLREASVEHEAEVGAGKVPVDSFVEWLAEWGREFRRRQRGLLLLTAHRAKGLEFDHAVVLDGGWDRVGHHEDSDAPRRLYYVAMTRARQTLALGRFTGPHPVQDPLRDDAAVLWRDPIALPEPVPEMARHYRPLGLRDVYLSFAGRKPRQDRLHRAIAALSPGNQLQVRQQSGTWELLDRRGIVVGALARSFDAPGDMRCVNATVTAVVSWKSSYSDPQYQRQLKCDGWEVVLPELIFEPNS
jgi:ATP-dependent DNA helicase RecQ